MDISEVFILNGHIEKCDGNYIPKFNMSKVGDTGVWIGPYIANVHDMHELHENKIGAVLNLLTHRQMVDRGIDWATQQ